MKLNRTVRVGPAAVYTIETGRVLPGVAATMAPDDVVSIGVDTAKGESFARLLRGKRIIAFQQDVRKAACGQRLNDCPVGAGRCDDPGVMLGRLLRKRPAAQPASKTPVRSMPVHPVFVG